MDPEINAMQRIAEALEELEDSVRKRVLNWASDRFGVEIKPTTMTLGQTSNLKLDGSEESIIDEDNNTENHKTFAEFFADVGPSTHPERVLTAAYWHQEVLGKTELTSAELNKDLKDLGYAIKNISQRFDSLMGAKPQLAIQLKKAGNAKQARKKYKITKAGIDKINTMLGSES